MFPSSRCSFRHPSYTYETSRGIDVAVWGIRGGDHNVFWSKLGVKFAFSIGWIPTSKHGVENSRHVSSSYIPRVQNLQINKQQAVITMSPQQRYVTPSGYSSVARLCFFFNLNHFHLINIVDTVTCPSLLSVPHARLSSLGGQSLQPLCSSPLGFTPTASLPGWTQSRPETPSVQT